MKSIIILFLTLAVAATVFGGAIIRDGSLQARSDGNNVSIQWNTSEEAGLKEFDVERQAGTESGFVAIGSMAPKGPGSFYEFIDQTAFKSVASVYQYRIKIVSLDGSATYSKIITVSHNVSSVKRTWGSLKAMFR